MTALTAVAAYLPETSLSVEDVAGVLGLDEVARRRYRRFLGLDRVRWDPGARQVDLLLSAADRLTALRGNEHRVRYVLHARTIEPTGPYSANPLHEAVRKLGLGHATAFAVSQHACASGLLAVRLAGRLLAADGDRDGLALVLTGEKTYPHVARFMPPSTIMGEAAAACLVGAHGDRDVLVAAATRTYGEYHQVATHGGDLTLEFERRYPAALRELILECCARGGLDLDDVRLILPHNVNRISWTRLCQLLGLGLDRVLLDNIAVTGHSFCADPFVNHELAVRQGRLAPGDHYLMVSVGLGAVFSALLLRH
ncbi:MAG TPA: 3-oxoacyl-[acyl-carrier-protein] synthase III C-terminal domain-containing protein [Pseudonocardiaceae bacterium]